MSETQPIPVAPRPETMLQDVRDASGLPSQSRPGKTDVVNEIGCFDSDRVIKCGYVERRTRKTKKWKTIYVVLRPNALSMYKNEKETKLRRQVCLSDLTAVACLKDPKHKRQNVFGLFSPSRNYHFQAPTSGDAREWVDLIRKDARIEEEESEMILASPPTRSMSPAPGCGRDTGERELAMLSSSPETGPGLVAAGRRESSFVDWSGLSGNEMPSHSDLSDNEGGQQLRGASLESLAVQLPPGQGIFVSPAPVNRSASQLSILNDKNKTSNRNQSNCNVDQDPDRVVWQGWLWILRSKGGVRQWKDMWAVLRPRNLILYKDESEYTAQWILHLSAVVDVVDIDPLSKSKQNCLQVISEEKGYRFCAHDEESLVHFLGAFKSLLAKRRGLEARVIEAS
ncbi:putative PH domain-containing protein PB16A4.02c [Ophiocordyceps camponoti-floridani]|uniref:Putative PH domain-containing protein PB16A4.02c n=1 Tax=Ophiocordyceps camponoti-floridani TaxID=2030778 RepID=A0A8H4VCC1_9HYPO|nr:putative PH domain-containing protein PB16A4.02c [Ophiocordyceps camponoti-floridani]